MTTETRSAPALVGPAMEPAARASDRPSVPNPLGDPGFWRRHLVLPLLVWVAGIAVFETTSIDLVLTDPFYDFDAHTWPLRSEPFVKHVLYEDGRTTLGAFGVAAFALWAASFRVRRLEAWRRTSIYVALCLGTVASVVAGLKLLVDRGTPAELLRYGGTRPFQPLFAAVPPSLPAYHEFPAAHAAGAFSLLSVYFVALGRGVPRPARWLVPGLAVGTIFAAVQHVRGMHLASHDWWSLGIAWFVALGLFAAFRGRM
jgi:membrane-associated PAP2 superfamily phosphatase